MSVSPPQAFYCVKIVFRAFRSKRCVDTASGTVHPEAYFRRARVNGDPDADGLSVSAASPEHAEASLRKSHGVASLHVGRVRTVRTGSTALDVVPDVDDGNHANVTGVPYREDDPIEAERVAAELARMSYWPARPLPGGADPGLPA